MYAAEGDYRVPPWMPHVYGAQLQACAADGYLANRPVLIRSDESGDHYGPTGGSEANAHHSAEFLSFLISQIGR